MSDDLESRLRDALRPVPPRSELTEQLIARLTGEPGAPGTSGASGATAAPLTAAARAAPVASERRLRRPIWWLPLGLAASLLLAVGIQSEHEREQRAKGLEARRQVIEALRVTNQKLDLAYRAVRDESQS
jgi:hypothetical protein